MADKREQILSRLQVVCRTVSGIVEVFRNHDEISERQKPCILILDADEQADERDPQRHPNIRVVSMTPEIYIMLQAIPADVGTALNGYRADLLAAIFGDATLRGYTLNEKGVRYEGCATGLARGRAMEASMGVSISFTYALDTREL